MKIINNLYNTSIKNTKIAIDKIISGEVIIYPTDTLYGFGADATNSNAISQINQIKGRNSPLSIIINDLEQIHEYAKIRKGVFSKINKLLPGPYTILLESKNNPKISPYIQCDSKLIGIRVIDNKFCNTIIKETKCPIVTTSVNIHGNPPMTDIKQIAKKFNHIAVFYSKEELISEGSTIIDFSIIPESIIRKGAGKY